MEVMSYLPGDAEGKLNYFEFKYPYHTEDGEIELSMIIQEREGEFRVIAEGK